MTGRAGTGYPPIPLHLTHKPFGAHLRSMHRPLLVFAIAAGLAACSEPIATPVYDLEIVSPHVWAGGEIRLRFTGWRPPATRIIVDTDTFETTGADSLITVPAPQANGAVRLTVLDPGNRTLFVGEVLVYGFRETFVGPASAGYLLPWPREAATPTYLAIGASDRLALVDLHYRTAQYFPAALSSSCARGPGPSHEPSRLVLAGPTNCTGSIWSAAPGGFTPLSTGVPMTSHGVAELHGGWMLRATSHRLFLSNGTTSRPDLLSESPWGFRFSPRGDRVTVYYAYRLAGLLVFDAVAGDTAYSLPELREGGGAGFTPESDTLYQAGLGVSPDFDPPGILLTLRASDGQRYGVDTLDFLPEDVVVDPVQPYVYVFGWQADSAGFAPMIGVFSRNERRFVGRLLVEPFGVPLAAWCRTCTSRLVLDAGRRRLYLVGGLPPHIARATDVLVFNLLP